MFSRMVTIPCKIVFQMECQVKKGFIPEDLQGTPDCFVVGETAQLWVIRPGIPLGGPRSNSEIFSFHGFVQIPKVGSITRFQLCQCHAIAKPPEHVSLFGWWELYARQVVEQIIHTEGFEFYLGCHSRVSKDKNQLKADISNGKL